MFFLPLQPNVRFAALPDTPELYKELQEFMSVQRSWREFYLNPLLSSRMLGADENTLLNISHITNRSYIVGGVGYPQITFIPNVKSALIVYGPYSKIGSTESFSSDKLLPGFFRWEVSSLSYTPTAETLQGVWNSLSTLDLTKVSITAHNSLLQRVAASETQINVLKTRQDPVDAVTPILSIESGKREKKDLSLQDQIILLQIASGGSVSGTLIVDDATKGIVLKSPNGTYYRVTVSDTGTLTTTSLGTTRPAT